MGMVTANGAAHHAPVIVNARREKTSRRPNLAPIRHHAINNIAKPA
jgi:hypothetical protein